MRKMQVVTRPPPVEVLVGTSFATASSNLLKRCPHARVAMLADVQGEPIDGAYRGVTSLDAQLVCAQLTQLVSAISRDLQSLDWDQAIWSAECERGLILASELCIEWSPPLTLCALFTGQASVGHSFRAFTALRAEICADL